MRFSIDVLGLDAAGRVVDAIAVLKPWRMRLPRRGCVGVLELAAGAIRRSGTQIGDAVVFEVPHDAQSS
jgi:uncharacterized membrane protein (UPF0127 family)